MSETVHVKTHACLGTHVEQNNPWELVLFFYNVSLRDQTQAIRLVSGLPPEPTHSLQIVFLFFVFLFVSMLNHLVSIGMVSHVQTLGEGLHE